MSNVHHLVYDIDWETYKHTCEHLAFNAHACVSHIKILPPIIDYIYSIVII